MPLAFPDFDDRHQNRFERTRLFPAGAGREEQKDLQALKRILSTKVGREAYQKQFDADPDELIQKTALYTIPDELFYDTDNAGKSELQKTFDSITNLR